jgi:hypothetical protein
MHRITEVKVLGDLLVYQHLRTQCERHIVFSAPLASDGFPHILREVYLFNLAYAEQIRADQIRDDFESRAQSLSNARSKPGAEKIRAHPVDDSSLKSKPLICLS